MRPLTTKLCAPTLDGDPTLSDAGGPSLERDDAFPVQIGRYVVLSVLGEGGMGVVYEALDPELDRKVAVKVLRRGRRCPINAEPRLLREAQALAQLSHPNVVAIYDVGVFKGQVFLAMEHVDGITLGAWRRQRQRSWRAIVAAYVDAGRGLAAAHRKRIVHRDFKPDNLLIDVDGRVRVLDFGLAFASHEPVLDTGDSDALTVSSRLTMSGLVMGTPAYMAPEQLRGEAPDARSDQFGFCVALYEALYGHRPYDGDTLRALSMQTERGEIRVPSRRGVPAWIHSAIMKGLGAAPENRWPTMDALLGCLDPERRSRRRRTLAASAVLATVAAAAVGAHAHAAAQQQPCRSVGEKLQRVWNDDARRAVVVGLTANELGYATETATRVQRGLDEYADQWVATRHDVCRAGDHAPQLDRQMRCLDERLDTFSALVDVLSNADPDVVSNAARAVARLPRLSRCTNVDELQATVPTPPDAETAADVDELRHDLAVVGAHELAGRYVFGLTIANGIAERARRIGFVPLIAEATLQVGMFHERLGHYDEAAASLGEAAMLAIEADHTEVAARAMTQLTGVTGYAQAHKEEGLDWGRHALAAMQRVPMERQAQAQLESNIGAVLFRAGDYHGAMTRYEAVRDLLADPTDANETHDLASTHNNLGNSLAVQGRLEEAREHLVTALSMFEELRGSSHPDAAVMLGNLGNVYLDLGQFDDAVEVHERALQIRLATLPGDHPNVASSYLNLGMTHTGRGDFAQAKRHILRAVALKEATHGEHHPDVALAVNNLGEAQRALGEFPEAIASHTRALEIWSNTLGTDHPLVAYPTTNLGLDYLEAGELDKAQAQLERALLIRSSHRTEASLLALTKLGLARTLVAKDVQLRRAGALASDAADALAGTRYPRDAAVAQVLAQRLAEGNRAPTN